MNSDAQRIAIAKACGWTKIENVNTMAIGGIWKGYPPTMQIIGHKMPLPDYLTDFNAMHEAEKALTNPQWEVYACIETPRLTGHGNGNVMHATAAQRAEAFLRTLNLWEVPSAEVQPAKFETVSG